LGDILLQDCVVVLGTGRLLSQSCKLRAGVKHDSVSLDFGLSGQLVSGLSFGERTAKPGLDYCRSLIHLQFELRGFGGELCHSHGMCGIGKRFSGLCFLGNILCSTERLGNLSKGSRGLK